MLKLLFLIPPLKYESLFLAPMLPVSTSLEVVMTRSLEATSATEPTSESADPALQVSQQTDQEVGTSRDPGFELGCIRKDLVIEPTHLSNSGTYYCATADDVAQLIVKNQGDIFIRLFLIPLLTYDHDLECRANTRTATFDIVNSKSKSTGQCTLNFSPNFCL